MAEEIAPGSHNAAAGNGRLAAGAIMSKLSWGLCSDPGPTRTENEDFAGAFVPTVPDDAWDRGPLFAVADGLGGHAAGEKASRMAVDVLLARWTSETPGDPVKSLRGAVREADAAVLGASFDPGQAGMGTTLTALTLMGREAVLAHVGDSRGYVVRRGTCVQLTSDHSRVAEMVRMKLISPEQAVRHPARSQLTRSLGAGLGLQVDIVRQPIEQHDVFILCSDGLWDELAPHELAEAGRALVSGSTPTPAALAKQLVDTAIERGAADNVTAVVVRVATQLPIPAAESRRSFFRRRG